MDEEIASDVSDNLTAEVNTEGYRNMSEEEIEIWRNFLLNRDGYRCNRCNKTVQELIAEDIAVRKALNKKPRVKPVLTINHRNGDSRITAMPGSPIGSNLELCCYSCNLLARKVQSELPQVQVHDISGTVLINRKKMPKYLNHVKEQAQKFGHYCLGEALSSGCKSVGIKSQITAERYIEIERGTNGLFDVYDFDCESPVCKGKHIFMKGQKPIDLTDEQFVEMKERERTFLQIQEDENPLDPFNRVLDNEVKIHNLPFPLSTEQDAFRKFHLNEHVTKYFEKLSIESKYYHRLGIHGKTIFES